MRPSDRSASSTGSSPHTRGAHPARCRSPTGTSDHPRIRGEHVKNTGRSLEGLGSSPHTRGARQRACRQHHVPRIIPAYAGSTPNAAPGETAKSDHPRIRGEHNNAARIARGRNGSSPHTRGAPDHQSGGAARLGIIPAYAGSTARTSMSARSPSDHPRIRGEHHNQAAAPAFSTGSSPHTRGARGHVLLIRLNIRIIPAYAGSTISVSPSTAHSSDHPRIRGEHHAIHPDQCRQFGSSPHTRGARRAAVPDLPAHRIIPAYAGSTLSDQLNLEVHLLISIGSYNFRSRQEPVTAWG
jgi:hypothetical protein